MSEANEKSGAELMVDLIISLDGYASGEVGRAGGALKDRNTLPGSKKRERRISPPSWERIPTG